MTLNEKQSATIVCLPTYNEENSVAAMIDAIRQQGWEVFVTDGGSNDKTVAIATEKKVSVLLRPGKGKGVGMKQGVDFAIEQNRDFIVFIDCDMTYPVEKIDELVSHMDTCDMAVGARKMEMIALGRRMGNYLFTTVINLVFGSNLKDTQSGLRVMKAQKFKDIITAQGFDVETEISCKALKRGYTIYETEINYFPRVGESKVNILDSFLVVFRILKTRFAHL